MNLDLYAGGVEITEKECKEYIKFVERILVTSINKLGIVEV